MHPEGLWLLQNYHLCVKRAAVKELRESRFSCEDLTVYKNNRWLSHLVKQSGTWSLRPDCVDVIVLRQWQRVAHLHLLQMRWSRIWGCWWRSCGTVPAQTWFSLPAKEHETEIKDQGRFSSKDQICDCRLSSSDYKNTYTLNSHSSFKKDKKTQIDFTPARQSPFISIKNVWDI